MPTVLITGGHSGIGRVAVEELAARGADLVLLGRSTERMRTVAEELRSRHDVDVTRIEVDLSSLASTRKAAGRVLAMVEDGTLAPLDALLANAGGRHDGPLTYGPEGFETTFTTNVLADHLLVSLLLPVMAPRGRIVLTASGTHDRDSTDGRMVGRTVDPAAAPLARAGRDGHPSLGAGVRYASSKLCLVMDAYERDRRLRAQGSSVEVIAYDPGLVPGTGFVRDLPRPVQAIAGSPITTGLSRRLGGVVSDVDFSGVSLARLAVDPDLVGYAGAYVQANVGTLTATRSARISYDRERARRLWEDMEGLIASSP